MMRAFLIAGLLLQAAGGTKVPAGGSEVPAGGTEVPPHVQPQAPAASTRLPFDGAVTTGTLPNGMTYYIRKNTRPENRVELRLAVKAGSVDEADDQQGVAHFLEHMAFNGTRRFKPGELIATLESTGARMGPHLNAYTGFDETVYMFQLQTDREGLVEKGVQALADFAGGIAFDPKEVDKERGVVIEEWRGRLGAQQRILDQQVPVLFHESKYAERLPVGKPEIVKTVPVERVRAFYERWYRPDRMAFVVVGDVEPDQMLALVRKEFGALRKPAAAAPPREYPVPMHEETLVKVASDPEQQASTVSIMRKRPAEPDDTVADYRRSLVQQLVSRIFNERFSEIARRPDAPFLGAGAGGGALTPTVDTFSLSASVQHGKTQQGLAALVIEANRVKQHGVGPAELDRAKKTLLSFFERAYNERDKTESGSYAGEYVRHFLSGEPSPGIAYEFGLATAQIPAITAEQVSAEARRLLTEGSPVALAVSPRKEDVAVPTEEQLQAALTKADAVAVTAWADAAAAAAILETVPDPGAVKSRREVKEVGVTIVTYENGVEAWFKPTDFKNDEIVFSLVAEGGASLAAPEKYIEAQVAAAHVGVSGAGGHTASDLAKLLAGKQANAMPNIGGYRHGISGSSRPTDLETALQLLYIRFTQPGDDPQQFDVLKKQFETVLANRANSPTGQWSEKVAMVNTSGHYSAQPVTVERISKLDRAAMASFYRERFSNAADFTFFMVGAFKLEDAIPLVGRYVGSLPSKGKPTSTWKDTGVKFPATIERAVVRKGTEPKALTILAFAADPSLDPAEQGNVQAATEVLEIAMRDILREELGQTYTVSVGLSQPLPQRGAGYVAVQFGGAPDTIDKMVERTLQEVKRLQQEGPSEDLTNRAKEAAHREFETSMKQNRPWLGRLEVTKLFDRDPMTILERPKRIDAITRDVLHETFRKYFPLDRYTVVTLVPEKQG
jgi:zinc protease